MVAVVVVSSMIAYRQRESSLAGPEAHLNRWLQKKELRRNAGELRLASSPAVFG